MWAVIVNASAEFMPAAALAILVLAARGFARMWLLLLVFALFLTDALLLELRNWLPALPPPVGLWNWEGKIAALLLALTVLLLAPAEQLSHLGLFAAPPSAARFKLVLVAIIICGSAVARAAFFGKSEPFSAETLAFQAIMPGLHEELTFRGLWWLCLASALDQGRLDSGNTPWATLAVTTILFASVHAVQVSPQGVVEIEWPFFAATAVSGFLYGSLQAIGRAVWVPVIVHNLANVLIYAWQMSV